MSYYYEFVGSIDVSPPFSEEEVERYNASHLEGPLPFVTEGVIYSPEDRCYENRNVELFLEGIARENPDREFDGFLVGRGEEIEDIFRLYLAGGQVVRVAPEWPDPEGC